MTNLARRFGKMRTGERVLALLAIVVIGGAVAFEWVIAPLSDWVLAARGEVEAKQTKIDAVKRLLSKGAIIEQQYAASSEYLKEGGDAPDTHRLLDKLETISADLGLQLNFKPRGKRTDDAFSFFEIELEVQGSQDKLLGFMDELLRLPQLLTVQRFRITNAPTRDHQLKGNILLRQILLEQT